LQQQKTFHLWHLEEETTPLPIRNKSFGSSVVCNKREQNEISQFLLVNLLFVVFILKKNLNIILSF
jgi:hypothetical protein